MKYKAVIFDMDGTILDTLEDLTNSLNVSLEHFGYPTRSIDEVRQFVGNGIRLLIERGVPKKTSKEDTDHVHKYFMTYYEAHCADKTHPYPGIIDLMKNLRERGKNLAVVSNKADQAVSELCEQYFPGIFDVAVGEREGIHRKPAPDSVNEVLRILGVKKEEAVYVGDSEVDAATARNAGLDAIQVEWGFRDKEFMIKQGAKVFARDTAQLLDRILSEEEKQLSGMLFDTYEPELKAKKRRAHMLSQKYNTIPEDDQKTRSAIIRELIPDIGEGFGINGPLYVHYGSHLKIGKNFFGNFNLTLQDDTWIFIGDNCDFGPNCTIVTPFHPMLAIERYRMKNTDGQLKRYCYAKPVHIGNCVWLAADVTVCSGVTIGDNCVIGAGSVVTRDIPANSFAAGVPARVIRTITEDESVTKRVPELMGSVTPCSDWEEVSRLEKEQSR